MNKEKVIGLARTQFLKYGIRSVSMDDLSSRLGISKKTLYHEIENKRDLVKQVMEFEIELDRIKMESIKNTAEDALIQMELIAEYIYDLLQNMAPTLIYDLQKYYNTIWTDWEKKHKSIIYTTIKENLIRGKAEGFYRKDISEFIISRLYVGLASTCIDEDVFSSLDYNKGDVYKAAIKYHMHGILNEKGRALLTEKKKFQTL